MEIHKTIVNIDVELKELIPQFLENRQKDIEHLETLLQQNDMIAIASLAHKIKGTAAGYGFAELSKFASKIERDAKDNHLSPIQDQVRQMKIHFQNIQVQYIEM